MNKWLWYSANILLDIASYCSQYQPRSGVREFALKRLRSAEQQKQLSMLLTGCRGARMVLIGRGVLHITEEGWEESYDRLT